MAEDVTSHSCGKPLLFLAEFLEGYDVGADKGFSVCKNDDDNGNLHGLLGQTKPMPPSRDRVLYCSPKKREYGVDRTGHTDQPHNVARATVSDLFTAGASLAGKPQQASSWLLKLGLIPVCANSEGGGSHGTEASDRWKYRCWAPQVVAISQSDRSGPSRWDSVCTCCWRGQKRQVPASYLVSTSCSRRCSIVRRRAWNFMVSLIISLSSSSFNFSTKLSSTGISNLMY